MTEYVRQDADIIVLEDLVACPYCGMTGPTHGPDNIFVHLLATHPFSWQAEAISEAVLHI
jgi:hypothetical protein